VRPDQGVELLRELPVVEGLGDQSGVRPAAAAVGEVLLTTPTREDQRQPGMKAAQLGHALWAAHARHGQVHQDGVDVHALGGQLLQGLLTVVGGDDLHAESLQHPPPDGADRLLVIHQGNPQGTALPTSCPSADIGPSISPAQRP